MAGLDLGDTEQPMDPKLAQAIESAFRYVSMTPVQFVPIPRAWRNANPDGPARFTKKGLTKAYLKMSIARRDGNRCAYCAQEFVDLDDATLDHVVPNCVVGHWKPWNLLLSCGPCNNLKGDQIPLVLLPFLCHLLPLMAKVAAEKRNQPIPTRGYPSKTAAKRARKAAARIRRQTEALAGHPIRRAIEAPRPRLQLLPGQDGAR
jgi:hypothetical protein